MVEAHRPRRSALYLPASNPRAIEKARGLDCDVVILDLEDAVAPDRKAEARAAAVAAVAAGGFGTRDLVVRVNGLDTEWGADDLAALAGAAVILVPKIASATDVAAVADRLASDTALWVMIETPRAIFALDAIAGAPRVGGLVMGTNDLAKDMRADPGVDRTPLLGMLALTVAAARAHGRIVLDGVWNALGDDAGLAAQAAQGRAFGFDGKTVIHPDQIAAVNAAFTPTDAAVADARAIVAAFALPENAGKGAIRLDGRMVERLHLTEAERTLAIVAAIAAR